MIALSGKRTKSIDQAMAKEHVRDKVETLALILEEILSEEGDQRISLEEMKALEERKDGEHDFIAVISRYNLRFATQAWTVEYLEERGEAMKIKDEEKRQAALKEIERQQATKGLKELEKAVGDYLSWAQSQGLQN